MSNICNDCKLLRQPYINDYIDIDRILFWHLCDYSVKPCYMMGGFKQIGCEAFRDSLEDPSSCPHYEDKEI